MCEFLSFVITKDGRVLANDLSSHEGIESLHKLRPDTYREAEWTGEDYDSLTVRLNEGEIAGEYLSHVQSRFKSRKDLLNYFFKNSKSISGSLNLNGLTSAEGLILPKSIGGWLDLSGLTSAEGLTLPKSIGGSLDLNGLTSADREKIRRVYGK